MHKQTKRISLKMIQYIEKEVTVSELKELFETGEYEIEISSPDGYQPITRWFDKGVLNMVCVQTETLSTNCAVNHMIQLSNNTWSPADHLVIGDKVITTNGIESITSIKTIDPAECYDFTVDHENHRYYGDGFSSHNSGKSFLASGNIVREAQKQGIYVFLIDSENALDEKWLHALGVDTSEDKMTKLNMAMINDVAKTISEFVEYYKGEYANTSKEERPKVLWVVDSLGMLLTPVQQDQFKDGLMKGDMGHKAKALKSLVTNCLNSFGDLGIGLVATNHTYASQNMFDPSPVMAGGAGFLYAASIVIAMQKLNLKEDIDGNKISNVTGIRSKCKVMKSRYAKPFEQCELKIPYETGMDPYTGLLDMFEQNGLVEKQGNRLRYINIDTNEEILMYRKAWGRNDDMCLDLVMNQFNRHPLIAPLINAETSDEDDEGLTDAELELVCKEEADEKSE